MQKTGKGQNKTQEKGKQKKKRKAVQYIYCNKNYTQTKIKAQINYIECSLEENTKLKTATSTRFLTWVPFFFCTIIH